jgi:O-antigen ligase
MIASVGEPQASRFWSVCDLRLVRQGAALHPAARILFFAGVATLGALTVRVASVTLSDAFLFLAFVIAAVGRVSSGDTTERMSLPRFLVAGVALYAVAALVSTVGAAHPGQSLLVLVRVIIVTVGLSWLAVNVLRTSRDVAIAIVLWAASMAVAGAVADIQVAHGGPFLPGMAALEFGRATGLAVNPDDFASGLAIALVPALSIAYRGGARALVLGALATGLVVSGIVASQSVAAVAAGAAGVVVWCLVARPIRYHVIAVGACVVGAVVLAAAGIGPSISQAVDRFTTVTNSGNAHTDTFGQRLDLITGAWSHISDNPFVGVGLGRDNALVRNPGLGVLQEVHNLFVATWFQTGLLGLLAILAIVAGIAALCVRTLKRARSADEGRLAAALTAALTSALVVALAQVILFQRYVWLPVALLMAARAAQLRRDRSAG